MSNCVPWRQRRHHRVALLFIDVCLGLKYCSFLLGTAGLWFATRNARMSAVLAVIFRRLDAQHPQIWCVETLINQQTVDHYSWRDFTLVFVSCCFASNGSEIIFCKIMFFFYFNSDLLVNWYVSHCFVCVFGFVCFCAYVFMGILLLSFAVGAVQSTPK